MSREAFVEAEGALREEGAKAGERIVGLILGDETAEVWTTEAIYASGHGGGMSRVQKTDYGWQFPYAMLGGEKAPVQVLHFWDFALANTTCESVKAPFNMRMIRLDPNRLKKLAALDRETGEQTKARRAAEEKKASKF